jgi:hypothetical protein
MTYDLPTLWRMFLGTLEHSVDEDMRHAFALLQRDRFQNGLHDRELRSRLEAGQYGGTARRQWGYFKSANE